MPEQIVVKTKIMTMMTMILRRLDTDSNDSGECAYHIDDLDLDLDPDLDLEGAKKNLPTTKIRSSR